MSIKKYLSLIAWIVVLMSIGSGIGILTKGNIDPWYMNLNRSPLSPPNYVFGIAWSILYAMIAISGWLIWETNEFPKLASIKKAYLAQLLFNWSWTPLFFYCHFIGIALDVISVVIVLVAYIIFMTYKRRISIALLLTPYLLWSLFAWYLNLYIWLYN